MCFKESFEHYLISKEGHSDKWIPLEMKDKYKSDGWKIVKKVNLKRKRED